MRYLILIFVIAFSTSAIAAEKSAQQKDWTNEYQYGESEKAPAEVVPTIRPADPY